MLESYILQNMIEIIKGELEQNNNPPLKKIHISIGDYYPIDSESFAQSFNIVAKKNLLAEIKLKINRPQIMVRCNLCKNKFEVKSFTFRCFNCKGQDLILLSGDELRIDYLEVY